MTTSGPSTSNDLGQLSDLIRKATTEFGRKASERLEIGAEEYGKYAYLGNDVLDMLMEELLDTANYAMMQYVKIYLIKHTLEDGGFIPR